MPVARLRPISPHIAAVDLHGRFQVAAFLVRHEDGLLLVDTGFPGWGYAILTAASSLPEPTRITEIILTHAHADHIGGTPEIVEQTDATVLASAEEKPFIEGRSLAKVAHGLGSRLTLALNHFTQQRRITGICVDRTLAPGDSIHGLEVLAVPGHTPGQLALIHRAAGLILCADALFNVAEAPGLDPVPGMTTDPTAALASIEALMATGLEDLAPSHGPAILGDAQAKLSGLHQRLKARR
jgi:glyoxylase-like metal-dependent hydrolase (beta-lactamase superfamily II)